MGCVKNTEDPGATVVVKTADLVAGMAAHSPALNAQTPPARQQQPTQVIGARVQVHRLRQLTHSQRAILQKVHQCS